MAGRSRVTGLARAGPAGAPGLTNHRRPRRRKFAGVMTAALALAVVQWSPIRASGASEPDLVAFARAFNAAWNAHDVAGVVSLFAQGATVRQTGVRTVIGAAAGGPDAPEAEDCFGAGPAPSPTRGVACRSGGARRRCCGRPGRPGSAPGCPGSSPPATA